jgi:acyl carrier protein
MDRFAELKEVLVRYLDAPPEKIVPEASFRDDLGATSVVIFDLILELEDHFGIEIPDEEAVLITTVGDAVEYLKKKLG